MSQHKTQSSPNTSSGQTKRRSNASNLERVAHIVAIASGKGGVGKSTMSANLAVALQFTGAKVGLMDADIYGASQPGMFGVKAQDNEIKIANDLIQPLEKHGVKFMSVGLLMAEDTAVIWRAPMVVKLIQQFLHQVEWGELDYLLIDLPPGTGDIQLSLSQMADLSGAVIVTTPQEVSLGIAKKGLNMFKQVQVPIIGIIENMSGFTCPHCGNTTEIFKRGGGEDMARVLDLPFLGAIPLDPAIMHSAENGVPIISQAVSTPASHAFLQLAENFCHALTHGALGGSVYPVQEELDPETGKFHIQWSDQAQTSHDPYSLRTKCKCALCIDEDTGRQILDPKRVPLDIQINSFNRVGRYAYSFNFSDGHSTGIFTFDRFRDELNERELDSFSV